MEVITVADPFTITGFDGDVIGNGMSASCNSNADRLNNLFLQVYTQNLTVTNSETIPFMYYNNPTTPSDQTKIAGVHREIGNSRIVYSTCGVQAIGEILQRDRVTEKILDWLFKQSGEGPHIDVLTEIVFNSTMINEKDSTSFIIKNTGNQALTISNIQFDKTVFKLGYGMTVPIVIPAYQEQAVTVVFQPTAAQTYLGTMTITHDAVNDSPTIQVSLSGDGEGSEGPIISVSNLTNNKFDFGKVVIDEKPEKEIILTNTGTKNLKISAIGFKAGSDIAFDFVTEPNVPTTVASQNTFSFKVVFIPLKADSTYKAVVSILF